jgi:tRNA threonylcarbamoyladenosine biosynthesis protein TsaB
MAKILLLETATEICSVGLSLDGRPAARAQAEAPQDHARMITLLIEQVLAESSCDFTALDAVAVSHGPGSYTSLRIGMATAKGIAFSLQIPLLTIDTLQALAIAARQEDDDPLSCYAPMIDARREEVYTAVYNNAGQCMLAATALVLSEDALAAYRTGPLVVCGNGGAKSLRYWSDNVYLREPVQCRADWLAPLAEAAFQQKNHTDLVHSNPIYLKPPYVTQPKSVKN